MNNTSTKKSRLLWVILPVSLVVIVVATILIVKFVNGKKNVTDITANLSEALMQSWQNTPSDIENMTKWDKYAAGLSVKNGSDTDGDGLTDKEELEVYGTDPLKVSTADDLYTDGYKIAHGMNPTKAYEYEGAQVFMYNQCDEVQLHAETPTDFNAVVTPHAADTLMDLPVYAAYRVYNYSGKFSVDLGNILERSGVKAANVAVYISDGNQLLSCGFTKKNQVFTTKKALKKENTYIIYFIEKNFVRFASTKLAMRNSLDALPSFSAEERPAGGLVIFSPILTVLFDTPIRIRYEDLGDEVRNETHSDAVFQHYVEYMRVEDTYEDYEYDIAPANIFEIKVKYSFLHEYLPGFNVTHLEENEFDWPHVFLAYYSYYDKITGTDSSLVDDVESIPSNTDKRPATDTVSGFHPTWDTLPFGNFNTSHSPNGSCAGIAHLTTYLFNQQTFPAHSGAAPWESEIQWDLTTDADNYTLTNPGLNNYKTSSFIQDHSTDGVTLSENLSTGEEEFLKMIVDAYLAGNKNAEFICYELLGGDFSTVKQDYSVIDATMAYLDSGKIVTVYLAMTDGTRHAVNVYDYTKDGDTVYFKVYDSNYPNNSTDGQSLSEDGFTLKVEKKVHLNGNSYTFSYDYFPFKGSDYGATSNTNRANHHLILILDEFGHLLND